MNGSRKGCLIPLGHSTVVFPYLFPVNVVPITQSLESGEGKGVGYGVGTYWTVTGGHIVSPNNSYLTRSGSQKGSSPTGAATKIQPLHLDLHVFCNFF